MAKCLAAPAPSMGWYVTWSSCLINLIACCHTQLHVRGQPEDYDEWSAMGNSGWSFEEVLPYFKKCEDHEASTNTAATIISDEDDQRLHGIGGESD